RARVRHCKRGALDRMVVELVLELVARPARAGAGRVAALNHEVLDHAVEDHAVIEPVAGELEEVADCLRRVVVEELDLDRPMVGLHRRVGHAGTLPRVSLLDAVLVFLGGLAAGTINVIVGSGTLITFPVLLAVGYSPVVANVSNTIGLVPGSLAGAVAY